MKKMAEGHLRSALYLIEKHKHKPTPEVLESIKMTVQSAIDILLEPDHLTQRIAYVLLTIKMSTAIVEVKNPKTGKKVFRVSITDQVMYAWAMNEVHNLAAKSAR